MNAAIAFLNVLQSDQSSFLSAQKKNEYMTMI